MITLNISAPILRDSIRDHLEESEEAKYTYLGMIGPIEMQFSVNLDNARQAISTTKRIIRNIPYGNIIMFRVLLDGQFFENGPVYKPGDPEYAATRPGRM